MKITKGQLKRIIAEEHAVVYGKKRRGTVKGKAKKSKQVRLNEAKRQLIVEAQARVMTGELLEEGFFDSIKSIFQTGGGVLGDAGEGIAKAIGGAGQQIVKQAGELKKQAKNKIGALKKAGEDKIADIYQKYLENYVNSIGDRIEKDLNDVLVALKKVDTDMDDDELKAQASEILTTATTTAISNVFEGKNRRRARLVENKKRRQRRRR